MAPELYDQKHYFFCLKHRTVEDSENRCRSDQRLGPYKTRAEAERALEHARQNTEAWDAQDGD